MKHRNEIVLIIPYFGSWPDWFGLYLLSCSNQRNIDFVFYTDCKVPSEIYANTIFVNIPFVEYCKRVSQILNIDFRPADPYKLCDLKPFLGVVHKELVSKYKFWGFGDVDVVYGNLQMIVNTANLSKYDLITTHTNRVAGHFTIMRSNSRYTENCLSIRNYAEKLLDREHLSIDEDDWALVVYPELKWLRRLYRYILEPVGVSMRLFYEVILDKIINNRLTRRSFVEYGTTPLPREGEAWCYYLENGKVISPYGVELPYLHFLFFKKCRYKRLENYWKQGFYQVPKQIPQVGIVKIDFNHMALCEG